jgi:hypothetical protein
VRPPLRSRLPIALFTALALAITGAGCGEDEGSGESSGDAKALLERAFTKQVKSGELDFDLTADIEGGGDRLEEPLALRLKGPFEWGGAKRLPRFDWDVSFKGVRLDMKGGLIATADNAFVELQGQAYELGTRTFTSLAREYAALQPGGRPQSLGAFGVDPTSWLKDPQIDSEGESIGGEPTRKITGSVDVRKAVRDIVGLTRSPRLRKQLQRRGQPAPELSTPKDEDLDELEDAVEEFDIEVNVDRDDVVRRLFTEFDFDVPGEEDGDDVKGGKVSLSYVLTRVNTTPVIRAPQNPKPLAQLLDGFGLGGLGSGLGRR